MRKIFTLALFFGTAMFVQAQTKNGKVTGSIKDGPQKNLQYATISLLRAKDSSSIKFSVTNKDGVFEFTDLQEGKYLVSVTLVGYEKAFSNSFEVSTNNAEVALGTIVLTEAIAKGLSNVTVTAKKPFI